MMIVTGFEPHLKTIFPPLATAETTASEVQLSGVPVPMTRLGLAVLTARPAVGTFTFPDGFPAVALILIDVAVAVADADRDGVADALGSGLLALDWLFNAGTPGAAGPGGAAQAAKERMVVIATINPCRGVRVMSKTVVRRAGRVTGPRPGVVNR